MASIFYEPPLLTYHLETNYHGRTQTQSSFIIALTSHLFWLGLHGRDFTALQCWNHVLSLTEHALDGESVLPCVVQGVRQKGCLFFTILSFVSLQVDCIFFPVPFFPVHMGVTLSSWKAGFLSWFCPRNALVLFFYYHNTFPPSIVYLYTDSSYFYTHCKTINKSLSNAGLKNGNGTWKRKWQIKGVFSKWRIIDLLWHFFCMFL